MVYEEVQYNQEVSNIKTHKTLWFIFFGVIFIGIFLTIYFVVAGGQKNISNKKLIDGAVMDIGENESIKFKFGGEDHGIVIDFVGLDYAGITISSEPIILMLQINEARYGDSNTTGQPTNFAIFGTEMELWPTPDAAYTIEMVYTTYITALTSSNTTNWLPCNPVLPIRSRNWRSPRKTARLNIATILSKCSRTWSADCAGGWRGRINSCESRAGRLSKDERWRDK